MRPSSDDRAGAALADEAALLGAGQPEVVAEDVEQRVVRRPPRGARRRPLTVTSMGMRLDSSSPRSPAARRSIAVGQRPPAEHAQHREAVLGAGAHRARRRAGRRRSIRSRTAAFASSGAAGSARTPLSSMTSTRPRADAAVGDPRHAGVVHAAGQGHRGEVVAAPPGPPHVRGARRAGRERQLDGGDELAARERRHARSARRTSSSGMRRVPGRTGHDDGRRRRPAAAARCRPPATRCRCCRPASPGSGSGPSPRPRRPRRGPGSARRIARVRGDVGHHGRRRRSRDDAVAIADAGPRAPAIRLTSTTSAGAERCRRGAG